MLTMKLKEREHMLVSISQRRIRLLATTLMVFSGFISCSAVLVGKDWPMGRADVSGSGATSDPLPADLELLWEFELDGLGFDAGPIIANGKVFCNDHDGRVVALDLATGKQLWLKEFDTGFLAPPSYRDNVLYVADYDGVLHALNAADGTPKWEYDVGLEIDASANFFDDNILFTSQDGSLYSLTLDGKLNWKYETGDQLQCGPTLAGDKTFLGGCDAHLHVVNVRTGEKIGEPVAIDAPTGSTPSVLENQVFVPTYAGEIFSFEMPEANIGWRFRNVKLADELKNSLAIADGLAVATSRNKRVFAIDVKTGEVKWEQVLRKRSDASPIIAGESVIVAAADGRIIRFELQSGEQSWMTEVKGAFIGSPASADGKLVLTNDRGTVFCFGKK